MKIRNEVKIGIFSTVILLVLYWGVNFLKRKDIFAQDNTYYAYYEQVNGIQRSAAVTIKGFVVGRVEKISYDPTTGRIGFELNIKAKYKIPVDSKAKVFSRSMLSGKEIEIELGHSTEYLQSGQTIASAVDVGMFENASSELEAIKAKATRIADQLSLTLESINQALDSNNVANLRKTLSHVEQMTGSANEILSGEKEQLRSLIGNLNDLSLTLAQASPKIDKVADNLLAVSDSLRAVPLTEIFDNANSTIVEFRSVLAKVNSTEGSAGMLLNDPQLYEELRRSSANLAKLLADLQKNPGRYVHFSLFGGGKKNK